MSARIGLPYRGFFCGKKDTGNWAVYHNGVELEDGFPCLFLALEWVDRMSSAA